jgi:hypothetical protein
LKNERFSIPNENMFFVTETILGPAGANGIHHADSVSDKEGLASKQFSGRSPCTLKGLRSKNGTASLAAETTREAPGLPAVSGNEDPSGQRK